MKKQVDASSYTTSRDTTSAARKMQGDVKHHDGPLQGKIVEIRHDKG